MELINKLESSLADLYKGAPHLPKNVSKWIAENVWWIVLVAVVLSALGTVTAFTGLMALMALSGTAASYGVYYGVAAEAAGPAIASAWVALFALVVNMIILALAISPLKSLKRKGWVLLFVSDVVYFVLSVVSNLITVNVSTVLFGVIWAVIGAAVGFYFLFEIRSYFHGAKAKEVHAKKEEKK